MHTVDNDWREGKLMRLSYEVCRGYRDIASSTTTTTLQANKNSILGEREALSYLSTTSDTRYRI